VVGSCEVVVDLYRERSDEVGRFTRLQSLAERLEGHTSRPDGLALRAHLEAVLYLSDELAVVRASPPRKVRRAIKSV
jgi:hypothetical protein